MSFLIKDLRSQIFRGSADRMSILFCSCYYFGQAEVSELDIPFFVKKDVFWFEAAIKRCVTLGK